MLEMLNLDDKNATYYRHYCIYHISHFYYCGCGECNINLLSENEVHDNNG